MGAEKQGGSRNLETDSTGVSIAAVEGHYDGVPPQRAVIVDGQPTYVAEQQTMNVWGLFPVPDKETARLAKLVSILSVLCCIMLLISAALHFANKAFWWGMLYIFVAVLLPLAGMLGARRRNESMVMCFAACNCVFVALLTINWVLLLLTLISVASTKAPDGCRGGQSFEVDGLTISCRRFLGVAAGNIVLVFLEIVLYFVAFFYAYKLGKRIAPQVVVQPLPPVGMYDVSQPQPFGQPFYGNLGAGSYQAAQGTVYHPSQVPVSYQTTPPPGATFPPAPQAYGQPVGGGAPISKV